MECAGVPPFGGHNTFRVGVHVTCYATSSNACVAADVDYYMLPSGEGGEKGLVVVTCTTHASYGGLRRCV